jgi:hypothetical protein
MDRDVKHSDRDELRLIEAVLEGDAEQYHELIPPYERRVFKMHLRSCRMSWMGTADRLGIVASSVCFVHCLATPVLVSLSAVYAHFLPTEEHTHRVLAVGVTIIGALALGGGYRKHKKRSILWLMASGLALTCTGAILGDRLSSHWAEVAITLASGSCMIAARRKNHTFCRQCTTCSEP